MTPKQADVLINSGRLVTVHNEFYNETFTTTLVRRDRYKVYAADGGVYERSELQIVQVESAK